MGKVQSNFDFRFMSFSFKVRDFFNSPLNILKEADIKPGYSILDFGCGTGSYSIAASGLVGEKGKIYALDIHPLAVKKVKRAAIKEGLHNVETIQSDCKTGLPDSSMDIILLYDAYHDLYNKLPVLEELHRILKPEGFLSVSDHHMKREDILSELTGEGLFKLGKENKKTYSFVKVSHISSKN